MNSTFQMHYLDYIVFVSYITCLAIIGFWVGRKKKKGSEEYFLAGRTLPWYVVGSSYIASNISSEHFIGMVGAAFVYGICIAMSEWMNIMSFSVLIWMFIPFLLSARVFTTPEFMEKRFNPGLRNMFAVLTVVSNVVAFLAAVLYGGGLALQALFGWNLYVSILVLALAAASWVIYGGLVSIAWTDVLTVIIMILGGVTVTVLGLCSLSDSHSLIDGFKTMIERNQAHYGFWKQAVAQNSEYIVQKATYNRLSVIQPLTHQTDPWPKVLLGFVSIGIWYNVINQFMIQRVLAAKDMYHARMGIVLAGYMKILMPFIVVIPGLIMFAKKPEVLLLPFDQIRPEADKSYVHMLATLVPLGVRGLFLAALFGAIQSTVNAVLNSTATIFTLDIYKRQLHKNASDKHLVTVGRISTVIILVISIILACFINRLGGSLFVYIQTLYAFFAPPFASVFLLGILFKRINGTGALAAVISGFTLGILIKVFIQINPDAVPWLRPFGMQAIINWAFCTIVVIAVSLMTPPPRPEQVTDQLTINWKKINIFENIGRGWKSVVLWWGLFVLIVVSLILTFSGLFF